MNRSAAVEPEKPTVRRGKHIAHSEGYAYPHREWTSENVSRRALLIVVPSDLGRCTSAPEIDIPVSCPRKDGIVEDTTFKVRASDEAVAKACAGQDSGCKVHFEEVEPLKVLA